MPRRTRNFLRPVQRLKHVVDKQLALSLGVVTTETLINQDDTPTLAETKGVQQGSSVNAIYLKVEGYATSSGALSNCYMAVYKNPGGNLANIDPSIVGQNDNKRYVIHQEMIMFQKVTPSNPRTLFNGVIVLPRGMRRFSYGDVLSLGLKTPGVNADICFQCHYKEFR